MSDSKSISTCLLEVTISSENECILIHDVSVLTFQIIFHAWWASKHVASKHSIAWNDSIHAPSWWLYSHYEIEETGSPSIKSIVCHQDLHHPSEHWTSLMWKHLLAKAPIAKLYELTETEVTELTTSMVDETASAITGRQGSQGITRVSLQMKFIMDIQGWSIFAELTEKMVQTGSGGLWNFRISPWPVESLPHVTICFGLYSMEHSIISWATMVM